METSDSEMSETVPFGIEKEDICDVTSIQGCFGWEPLISGEYIPYIFRDKQRFCSVQMAEKTLLGKFFHIIHLNMFNCSILSFYITEAESRLLTEINEFHCNSQFSDHPYSTDDLIVCLEDVVNYVEFLDTCCGKLNGPLTVSDQIGFVRVNQGTMVPYVTCGNERYLPVFYFEGNLSDLKQYHTILSSWNYRYLEFCYRLQGYNDYDHPRNKIVARCSDIKMLFPPGSVFEDCWPENVNILEYFCVTPQPFKHAAWVIKPPKWTKVIISVPPAINPVKPVLSNQLEKISKQSDEIGWNQAYLLKKTVVDKRVMTCINKNPRDSSDWFVTFSDFVQNFFPDVPESVCMQMLNMCGVRIIGATEEQMDVLKEGGKCDSSVPPVQLLEVHSVSQAVPRLQQCISTPNSVVCEAVICSDLPVNSSI